jgi:hypothetical protein
MRWLFTVDAALDKVLFVLFMTLDAVLWIELVTD